MKKKFLAFLLVVVMALSIGIAPVYAAPGDPVDPEDAALAFNPDTGYTTLNVTVDGKALTVKKYGPIVYVANPVSSVGYQSMYVYVPETAVNGIRSGIQLVVGNSGWNATSVPTNTVQNGSTYNSTTNNATAAALAAGHVIAAIGTRSRSIAVNANGEYWGHAPACVVDSKAAIRYLKLNDAVMAGSAERIFITGTSGGGALSAAVAASGNSPDYYPLLAQIGAAGIASDGSSTLTDDIFATIAYCAITDLGNADLAYAWQYQNQRTLAPATTAKPSVLTQAGLDATDELAENYATYLRGLGLRTENGSLLTVTTMKQAIIDQVAREVEESWVEFGNVPALGGTFPSGSGAWAVNDWLDFDQASGTVNGVDYDKYLSWLARKQALKTTPAFDNVGTSLPSGQNETNLGGAVGVAYRNFTEWSWNNNILSGDGSGPDDTGLSWAQYITTAEGAAVVQQIKMINPLAYLKDSADADSAPYWYIRHGMADRDTAFAVELELYYAALNSSDVKDVNFELAWLQAHSGNYDVPEAYAWLAGVFAEANATYATFSGPTEVPAGTTAEYTVGLGRFANFALANIEIAYDGNLSFDSAQVIGDKFVIYEVKDGTAANTKIITIASLDPEYLNDGQEDILKLIFTATEAGSASVTFVGIDGYEYGAGNNGISINVALPDATTISTTVTYDPLDFNRDGVVNLLDLIKAQSYYNVASGDPKWSEVVTLGVDVNGDGIVDLADLIEIYTAISARLAA
ncbi:MAG: hypothetical protein LBS85_02175 [Clostridiales Family XIII bacterium]|nr:hypothetical protein [Clostridiales Family XIII bacterium]